MKSSSSERRSASASMTSRSSRDPAGSASGRRLPKKPSRKPARVVCERRRGDSVAREGRRDARRVQRASGHRAGAAPVPATAARRLIVVEQRRASRARPFRRSRWSSASSVIAESKPTMARRMARSQSASRLTLRAPSRRSPRWQGVRDQRRELLDWDLACRAVAQDATRAAAPPASGSIRRRRRRRRPAARRDAALRRRAADRRAGSGAPVSASAAMSEVALPRASLRPPPPPARWSMPWTSASASCTGKLGLPGKLPDLAEGAAACAPASISRPQGTSIRSSRCSSSRFREPASLRRSSVMSRSSASGLRRKPCAASARDRPRAASAARSRRSRRRRRR